MVRLFVEDFDTHTSIKACISSILLDAYVELKSADYYEPDVVKVELAEVTQLLNTIDPSALVNVEAV